MCLIKYSTCFILSGSHRRLFNETIRAASKLSHAAVPIIELREYTIFPKSVFDYTQVTSDTCNLRKSLTPIKYFGFPDTGGQLNVATHLYMYPGGYSERNFRRKVMASNKEWTDYVSQVRPFMESQKSTIFVEAAFVHKLVQKEELKNKIFGLTAIDDSSFQPDGDTMIELRRYHLKLGYDTVPKFLSIYEKGISSKLLAEGTDQGTSLVTLLYSEIGQLNEVIEVWRHQGIEGMEKSRVAARSAIEWREAIASIATFANIFTNSIHKPLAFSPLR